MTLLILLIYYSLGIIFLICFKVFCNIYKKLGVIDIPYQSGLTEDMIIIAAWIFLLILLLFFGLCKGINIISDKITNWILSFKK